MERQTGSTRLTGSPSDQGGVGGGSEDELLRAVKNAAAAEFEILGEMGRGERGSVLYLARERASRKLVALKLRPNAGEYELSVLRELDASIADVGNSCPSCNADLVGPGRFCSRCGADLSATRPGDASRTKLLEAVQSAAQGEYEVLGEMERSEGGGIVYFARELETGQLVALRLTREQASDGADSYALVVTQVIKPLVASLGGTYASRPSSSAPSSRTAAPSARSPQPAARSPTPPSVMIPDDLAAVEQPPEPGTRLRVLPVATVAGILLVAGALFFFSRARNGAPDASQDPATNVVVPAAPAPAPPPPPVATTAADSGAISIGALPSGARVTLNGKPVGDRQLSLPAGQYELVASAPGYRSASQTVDVVARDTFTWSPALQPEKVAAHKAAHTEATTTKAVSALPNCLNAYSEKEWTAAILACTREANAGSQPAQRNLGTMYDQGLGVSRDPAQAAVWFRKAAEEGNRDASFQLATMYENGRGVPQDSKQALDWYRKAALLGDVDSQVKLGRAYMDGTMVSKNEGEASAWFQRAADQGNFYALNRLGAMYLDGKGVPKDEARGVKLFQAAAAKGDPQGQFNLAATYAKGRGVQKSDSAANDLYIKSAKQGYADAIREARRRNLKF